ncbi:MAG: Tim44/TimA family putative adaptor protein [Pseudomonadota bacterium]|nr:Tim44/TimA family putative adaptor protein [Pseudomonadota bacterium]
MDVFAVSDIVVIGLLALFLIWRLRQVLGRRPENDQEAPAARPAGIREPAGPEREEPPLWEQTEEELYTLAGGLEQIRRASPGFDEKDFLKGAREAFRMIVTAFAAGDLSGVRSFLGEDVLREFEADIRRRQAAGQARETTLVTVRDAEIHEARMDGAKARIVVEFRSQQINVVRDAMGNVVEGDHRPAEVTDTWTFVRNTTLKDPNWMLVDTGTGAG